MPLNPRTFGNFSRPRQRVGIIISENARGEREVGQTVVGTGDEDEKCFASWRPPEQTTVAVHMRKNGLIRRAEVYGKTRCVRGKKVLLPFFRGKRIPPLIKNLARDLRASLDVEWNRF